MVCGGAINQCQPMPIIAHFSKLYTSNYHHIGQGPAAGRCARERLRSVECVARSSWAMKDWLHSSEKVLCHIVVLVMFVRSMVLSPSQLAASYLGSCKDCQFWGAEVLLCGILEAVPLKAWWAGDTPAGLHFVDPKETGLVFSSVWTLTPDSNFSLPNDAA